MSGFGEWVNEPYYSKQKREEIIRKSRSDTLEKIIKEHDLVEVFRKRKIKDGLAFLYDPKTKITYKHNPYAIEGAILTVYSGTDVEPWIPHL